MEAFFGPSMAANGSTHVRKLERVGWEEIVRQGTWNDLERLCRKHNGRAWLSPNVSAATFGGGGGISARHTCRACISYGDVCLYVWSDTDQAQVPSFLYQQLFRLLAKEQPGKIRVRAIRRSRSSDPAYLKLSADTLASLVATVGPKHVEIRVQHAILSRDQCEQLALYRGSLAFENCSLGDLGYSVFEAIGRDCSPTGLQLLDSSVDHTFLAEALQSTTTLETLRLSERLAGLVYCGPILYAMHQNHGLKELSVTSHTLDGAMWNGFFQALRRHETLEKLSLFPARWKDSYRKAFSARAVVDCLRTNTVLCELDFHRDMLDEPRLQATQIHPRLTENRYRLRVKAVLAETNESLQRKLMGEAITSSTVRQNVNLMFFMGSQFFERLVPEPRKRPAESEDPVEPEPRKRRREGENLSE